MKTAFVSPAPCMPTSSEAPRTRRSASPNGSAPKSTSSHVRPAARQPANSRFMWDVSPDGELRVEIEALDWEAFASDGGDGTWTREADHLIIGSDLVCAPPPALNRAQRTSLLSLPR